MKKYLYLFGFIVTGYISSFAQNISITTSNTPTVCYNDGSLTINASGGTAPYTDTIISGPANPNLIYPIGLPTGQNVFTNLPHGTFTIVVHDANGLTGTFTASVGGTYEFPDDTLIQNNYGYNVIGPLNTDTLRCIMYNGTGTAPFQYAISHTSDHSGFGNYQSQNFFTGMCPGQYWVRVIDNCGNIYTNTINIIYSPYAWPVCVNYTTMDVSLTAIDGLPPYSFNIVDAYTQQVMATSTTGNFTSLPFNLNTYDYGFTFTDSCGDTYATDYSLLPILPTYNAPCPFAGTLSVSFNAIYVQPGPFYPLTFSCLTCNPVQTQTFTVDQELVNIFSGLQPDSTYVFEMSDACGNAFIDTVDVAPTINIGPVQTSCRSIVCTFTFADGSTVPPSDIDSVTMLYNGTTTYVTRYGAFYDLPDAYPSPPAIITAYTNIGCTTAYTFYPEVPYYSVGEYVAHGPGCEVVWNTTAYMPPPENYFFISPANDTIFGQPCGAGNYLYPYLQPGTEYTLVSDSGCAVQIGTPRIPSITNTVYSFVNCLGEPVIEVTGTDVTTTSKYYVEIYHNGTLAFPRDTVNYNEPPYWVGYDKLFYPTDTGYYQYKIYRFISIYNDTINTAYDTICPQDSGTVYVTRSSIPYPYVNSAYQCTGTSGAVPQLTIYGGNIPYTIQIPGVDTFFMYFNTINFPTRTPGTYNVVAYDNCGISRSFTFSILDTCCGSVFAGNDTGICAGGSASLTATPQYSGGAYSWSPVSDTTQNITVSPNLTTPYIVTYTRSGCTTVKDTVKVTVSPVPVVAVDDTTVCFGSSAMLKATVSEAGGNYLWSPGGATSQSITVSPTTNSTYTVTYNYGGCAPVIDTGRITVSPLPVVSVPDTSTCAGTPVTITATVSQGGGSYSWFPGGATTQHITITPTTDTAYTVTYVLAGCLPVTDTTQITAKPLPSVSSPDTNSCAGSPVTLVATPSQGGGSYRWQPGGATSQNITVSPTSNATYIVTYTLAGCSSPADTVRIAVSPVPVVSVPGAADCAGTPVTLTATPSQAGGTYSWSPGGATSQSITVSPTTDTTYTVTYILASCAPVIDTARITVTPLPTVSVPDMTDCVGAPVTLTATPSQSGGTYSWEPGGGTTQSITVSPTTNATYTVTYSLGACPPVVDTGRIMVTALVTVSVPDMSDCSGAPVTLTATPSQSGGTYSWSPGDSTSQSITVSPVSNTTYTVTYSLGACAPATDTAHVTVTTLPTVTIGNQTICPGAEVTLTATVSQTGGTWVWSPGNETTQSITAYPTVNTTYVVQYTLPPCPAASGFADVAISNPPTNVWTYTHTGDTYYFTDSITGGTGPFTYLWNFGDGSPTSDVQNPIHTYAPNKQLNYTVTLIVSNGCGSDTISQQIFLPTGTDNISLDSRVSVYPNPNNGSFIIAVDGITGTLINAEITDVLGRSVYTQPIHTGDNKFDLDLAAGTYMVKVTYGQLSTVKMVMMK